MPSYRTCDREPRDLLDHVLKTWHDDLAEVDVRLTLLQAHARTNAEGEPTGSALKLHGYACMATVKINSVKDSVEGKADATVTLDGDRFFDLSHEEQVAVLDHELTHLLLVRDEDGAVVLDDANRPRLSMKLHDLQIGGFKEVVERHKTAALEAQQYRDLHQQMTQMTFPWG